MANNRTRAKRNAALRYAPEERALAALMQQADSDYKTDRTVANAVAHSGARAARASRKPIRKAYATGQTAAEAAKSDVDVAFGKAGAGADPYRAVTAREFGLNTARAAGEAATARTDAIARERDAKVGRVFALGAAKQQHNSAIHDLLNQANALAGEKGAFTLAQLDELRDAQAKERAANRRSDKTSQTQLDVATIGQGIDPKTGKPIPGGKADKSAEKKFKPATRESLRLFKSDYQKALDWASGLSKKYKRDELRKILTKGASATDKKTGKAVTIPSIDDQLALRTALDVVYSNFVTPGTERELHQYGVQVKQLPHAVTKKRYGKQQGPHLKALKKTTVGGLKGILEGLDWG